MPIIFILSSGADPTATFLKFADEMGFAKKMDAISLGQGQGPLAEKILGEGQDRGSWVLLQNCHLSVSWMPTLERLIEAMDPEIVHRDFRLWLTSMPSAAFPVAVLQDGAKVVMEPPKGLRTNVASTYLTFEPGYLDDCTKLPEWRKLLFGICFMHLQQSLSLFFSKACCFQLFVDFSFFVRRTVRRDRHVLVIPTPISREMHLPIACSVDLIICLRSTSKKINNLLKF